MTQPSMKSPRNVTNYYTEVKSSVIRQKGESQNGSFKKTSRSNFPKTNYFLPPDTLTYVCTSGAKKCSFFGKFDLLCFFETPVLRFALLPYYRRFVKIDVFCRDIFNENIANLVIDNAVCEKL